MACPSVQRAGFADHLQRSFRLPSIHTLGQHKKYYPRNSPLWRPQLNVTRFSFLQPPREQALGLMAVAATFLSPIS